MVAAALDTLADSIMYPHSVGLHQPSPVWMPSPVRMWSLPNCERDEMIRTWLTGEKQLLRDQCVISPVAEGHLAWLYTHTGEPLSPYSHDCLEKQDVLSTYTFNSCMISLKPIRSTLGVVAQMQAHES